MSRADGVHSSTCLHIAEPCDRPSCSWCSCDEEPLADWERDLLNEANATATLTAERDAARDIAVRLEGELAEVKVYLRGLRDRLRMDEVDAQGVGNFIAARAQVTMLTRVISDVDTLTAIPDEDDDTDPDAVIAEGES